MTAWQRGGADLVDVVTTWRNAVEQTSEAEDGFGRADRVTIRVVDSEDAGAWLRLPIGSALDAAFWSSSGNGNRAVDSAGPSPKL